MFRDIFSTEIWLTSTTIISLFYAVYIMSLKDSLFLRGNKNVFFSFIISIFVILYIGTRPLWCYADTGLYTMIFNFVQSGIWESLPSDNSEPFFTFIENICIQMANASTWLLVISTFYIAAMVWAAYKWIPRHLLFTIVFLFTAFSFWGYATNGIRHGMATSLSMLGLSFLMSNRRNIIIGYMLLVTATLTHTSCALILASATLALFYNKFSVYFKIWGLCIIISLIFQEQTKQLYSFIIDDNRMSNYLITMQQAYELEYESGYRWDFILYSFFPIILGWYTIKRVHSVDKFYLFILNTYVIANSFWVLINTTAFSNRFAYLSWFLYPILLAYPLSNYKIFKLQSVTSGIIIILSSLFTYFMLS